MSTSICSRCLARLQLTSRRTTTPSSPSSSSPFSTSTFRHATPPKKSGGFAKAKIAYRITTTPSYTGKRKKRTVPKLPAPGERKAARTRIVLSNTNALEVRDMDDLTPENMADPVKVGKMLALEGGLLDQLRDAKVFKKSQNWALFRRPATLMREESIELGKEFEKINEDKSVLRQVLCGDKMCGKSVLLLQAMSMAYINKWVVVNVPEAIDHVNNHHSYAPLSSQDANSPRRQYVQPSLTVNMLHRLIYSNEAILKSLKPHNPPPTTIFSTTPDNLEQIATYGTEHPAQSWPIFLYLVNELVVDGRPPLLFAVDGLNYWMGPTKYRNSDHETIHAHQFTVVQFFLRVLFTNIISMPNGGMVLGATTASNSPSHPTFDSLVQQLAALRAGVDPTSKAFPLPEPYEKLDSRVSSLLDTAVTAGTTAQVLKGLSRQETKGLLDYFMKSGLLKERVNDNVVGEKWAMSGAGNVGELCKLGGRARVDAAKVLTNIGTNVGIRMGQGEHVPKGSRK